MSAAAQIVQRHAIELGGNAIPDSFRLAMRQLASTVTVITASANGCEAGMTASSVCSVSMQPAQMLACVNRGGRTHELISESQRFAINILSLQQGAIARHYSTANRVGGKLTLGRWLRTSDGPPLLADALVAFSCEVQNAIAAATHTVFIGRVVRMSYRDGQPLVYRHGAFGQFSELLPEAAQEISVY